MALMILDPSPGKRVDVAPSKRMAFEVFGLGQSRPEPSAHDGAALSWLVGWHDCRHVDFSKNKAPDCSGADRVRAIFPTTLFLRMRVRTARMFVSLFAMLLSRSRVVLGIFMLPTRMVMFGLMMMMRCCVVMSSGIVMMLLRGMLRRFSHLWVSPCFDGI
jgi:hypothetical protein